MLIEKEERIAQICFINHFNKHKVHNFKCMEPIKGSRIEASLNPQEGTEFSFYSLENITIQPQEIKLIFTDLKCNLEDCEVLFIKSSLDNSQETQDLILSNGIGVIDSDYYDNETNEGNIGFSFYNRGYVPYTIRKGILIGTGWIDKYYTIKGDRENGERTGGFGST